MPVAATGPIAGPLEALRVSLSRVTAWQEWCGAPDEATALERIHLIELPAPEDRTYSREELEEARPVARINLAPGWQSARVGVPMNRNTIPLSLTIEADVPEQYQENARDAEVDFLNRLGAVVKGFYELGEGGNFVAQSISLDGLPMRSGQDNDSGEGDYYVATLTVEGWGAGS